MIINIQVLIELRHYSDNKTKTIKIERTYPEFLNTFTERMRMTKQTIMQLLATEFKYKDSNWIIDDMKCTNWEYTMR